MLQEIKKNYSYIVANEGGFELNSIEAREAVVKAMCILYEIGKADSKHNIVSPDSRVHILVSIVSDNIALTPWQLQKLEACAPRWSKLSYNDGAGLE